MALTETFSNSSIFLKICMILTPLQTLVYIIGFSTEHWVKSKISSSIDFGGSTGNFLQSKSSLQFTGVSSDQGLWKVETCFLNQCSTGDIPYVDGWLHATRFFATIGLIGFLVTTVGVFVCLFVTELSQRRILHILTTLLAAGTGVFVVVAVVIYGINYNNPDQRILTLDKDPNWSFGLCVAALILDIIATILLALNATRKPNV
ncbi:uncharacterized protein LOC111114360 isoform X1 [Crassostrea virginica]